MNDAPAEKNGKITLRQIVQWLIAAIGALLAFIGGQIVESLRGLHAEYGAMMREVSEQDKAVVELKTQVEDLRKEEADMKQRIDSHIDTEQECTRVEGLEEVKPQQFVAALGPAARLSESVTRIPALFTLAQGALESRWGASELATQAFNLFGVKADSSWKGATLSIPTKENLDGLLVSGVPAVWRRYSDWDAALADHAQFLQHPRYRAAFATSTPEDFARAIAAAGYATDPAYAEKLVAMIHEIAALPPAVEEKPVAAPVEIKSSIITGGLTFTAASFAPLVAWVLNGCPKPIPDGIPLLIAAGLLTLSHAVYNLVQRKFP